MSPGGHRRLVRRWSIACWTPRWSGARPRTRLPIPTGDGVSRRRVRAPGAFAAYVAALDPEETAAATYAEWISVLG
jgi:hypothetical protein